MIGVSMGPGLIHTRLGNEKFRRGQSYAAAAASDNSYFSC